MDPMREPAVRMLLDQITAIIMNPPADRDQARDAINATCEAIRAQVLVPSLPCFSPASRGPIGTQALLALAAL